MAEALLIALLCSLAGFAISFRLTAKTLDYAQRRRLLDQPGDRRSHSQPTPRGGGLGIVLASLAACAVTVGLGPHQALVIIALAVALAAVAAVGWLDDHRSLPIWPRLLTHALAALLLALAVLGEPASAIQALAIAVVALALVGLLNLWNFMDGIDGLAASQAALVSATLAVAFAWAGEGIWAALTLTMAAAIAGFLPFNLPQARIFLGDVGSGALGLLVGGLLLVAVERDVIAWHTALLLPSAFLLDGGLTLLGRMLRRERWWQPHRQHLYQWAVRTGLSHLRVTRAFAYWTATVAVLAGIAGHAYPDKSLAVAATLVTVGAMIWAKARARFQRIATEGKGA